ncbi:16S rRNA (guanine966-N2)-methyltransferase [Haloactinopolyspora alba]|uniref:16S rRNA (Guanine966-N2)-methyltransferase n=1 Tax=Haloactinopolyspora alba TaxID=648780 RepID=A0A2P8E8Y7_9ACTN|nr:16S rRNA (guanine(966)-N(2))-methyltransferase RsmD [Haloactinopolyspora alba]PSL05898.1 16S rRNA (guanine966-N2)-methyltransferase [Haloactinopolyspora alba]
MTRIVAGAARGRRLAVPPGHRTRPTSDRVREALFSALSSASGGLDGSRVLDLYAGSGALGLEALSRGAAHVRLVESDARAARVISANVERLGLPGAEVVHAKTERALATPPGRPYDVVLADPPYTLGEPELRTMLTALVNGWLAPGAIVVVERDRRSPRPQWPDGLIGDRERRYGETTLWYGHRSETSFPADGGS